MGKEYDWNQLGEKETDYRPRKPGLGIRDAIKNKTADTADSDALGQWFFKTIIAVAPLTKWAPTNALLKSIAMLGGTHNTKGISMPLWIDGDKPDGSPGKPDRVDPGDLKSDGTYTHPRSKIPGRASDAAPKGQTSTTSAKKPAPTAQSAPASTQTKRIEVDKPVFHNVRQVKPPEQMLHDAVDQASFLAVMHECLCRKIQGCKDYPIDLGCLFLGPAAHACVERGIAHEVTKEQAHAHIDRAKAVGLSASAYFVEVEEYVWGFHDKDMPNFLEICFCCPCCCSAVRFEQRAGGELKRILHQRSGWSCVVDASKCIGCGRCAKACPHDCCHIVDGKAQINQWCAGCGQCLKACSNDALSIRLTGETKPKIKDYFSKLHATW